MPRQLQQWLQDGSSLTLRLQAHSDYNFEVRLKNQAVLPVDYKEAQILQLNPGRWAWVREVELICNQQLAVTARSVVPLASLVGHWRRLLLLKNSSLGSFLYAQPNLQRRHLALYVKNIDGEQCWGRSALFSVGSSKLLLSEFFHPTYFS